MFDWDRFKQGKIKVILKTEKLAKDFYKECKKRGIDWGNCDYAIWNEGEIVYKYSTISNGLVWSGIIDDGLESIEWKGVKCMNELTFKEVIANIKEGEVWDCTREDARIKQIKMSGKENNSIIVFDFGKVMTDMRSSIRGTDKFKLKRKEYTFEEAFKSYEEGKEIESFRGISYKKDYEAEYNEDISIGEIRGKWYIND